jgi:hypothetical protein
LPVRSCATSSKSSGLAVASFVLAPVSAPSCSVMAQMVSEAVFSFRSYRAAVGPRHAPHRRAHCHRIPRPNLVLRTATITVHLHASQLRTPDR